jgi:DNA-binding MarR family transcriptional regulator
VPNCPLKDIPRYERILEVARLFPALDPSACEAYLHLLRAADVAHELTKANLVHHGMLPGRFTVLMMLVDKEQGFKPGPPRTPAELARLAGVTRATITGLVDTLEGDGWVRREPDAQDRRMMLVRLTPTGHQAVIDMLPAHFRQIASIMGALSEPERKTLVHLLDKMVDHTAGLDPARATPQTQPA